ncbi:signal peptidase I [candidate division KSB1 bacterium]|nr:signal peptidase I [candidate division KSB1 bacterium]
MRRIILKQQEFSELSGDILRYLRFESRGASMSPLIRSGDILTIQAADVTTLNVGDVALYRNERGLLIAHRVVGKRTQDRDMALLIRGDAPGYPDEIIQASQILGQVTKVQRGEKIIKLGQRRWHKVSILWARFLSLSYMLFRLARRMTKKTVLRCLIRV